MTGSNSETCQSISFDSNDKLHRKSTAKHRWKVLKRAIQNKCSRTNFLDTPGAKCSIMRYTQLDAHTYQAVCSSSNIPVNIRLPDSLQPLTPRQLIGFDNTGNICVWSSEEILLHFCISAIHLWEGKRVLELAGGSTALAGLWVSRTGLCNQVTLTDGHPTCVERIQQCVDINQPLPSPTSVSWLKWHPDGSFSSDAKTLLHQHYDVILAADCVFNDANHGPLSSLIEKLLSAGGQFVLVAPHRRTRGTSSLTQFAEVMASKGFLPSFSTPVSRDVCSALSKVGSVLTENQRPHLLVLSKPLLVSDRH